ncbi:hypothetical protein GE09DRAFT_1004881, partial [Coniochaeta sp. 2T2.1]
MKTVGQSAASTVASPANGEHQEQGHGQRQGQEPELPFLEAEEGQKPLPPLRYALLGVGVCLGLFLAMLDTSIVATSMYTIAAEFDEIEAINWVALAYTLTFLSFAVLFARISDVIGRRDTFLISFVIFIAFSLGCGFAKTLNQLIVCRALQGLGGSGLYSIAIIVFPEVTPEKKKNWIAGIFGVVIAVAGVLGPVIGGLLTHYASWRWIFWINGPIGAVSAVAFFLSWPKKEYLPNIERRKWKALDYLGSFLLIAASTLVCFAFQNGAMNTLQWGQAVFIAPIFFGSPIWEHAPAQGIIAQMRILGGSIGIAASSAILGVKTRNQLSGILSPSQLRGLAGQMSTLTPEQATAVRVAYTDALKEDMVVCCAVLAVGFFLTCGVYRQSRLSLAARHQQQLAEEHTRHAAAAGENVVVGEGQPAAAADQGPAVSGDGASDSSAYGSASSGSVEQWPASLPLFPLSHSHSTILKRTMASSSAAARRLQGKTILITGASSGIGRATALEFAKTAPDNGVRLILTARRIDALNEVKAEIESAVGKGVAVLPVKLDVSNLEEVKQFVPGLPEEWRDIHVLVNNAGLVKGLARAPEIEQADIDVMFTTNVTGLIAMTQAILPIFLSRAASSENGLPGAGDIINVGSIAGREPYAGGSIYCASKAAVRSFTDALRKELIATRVRVIEIDPGQVETEFSVVRFYGDKEAAKKVYEGVDPLTGEDIAEVVVFAATRRENVVIADTMVYPSHQAGAGVMHRRS